MACWAPRRRLVEARIVDEILVGPKGASAEALLAAAKQERALSGLNDELATSPTSTPVSPSRCPGLR